MPSLLRLVPNDGTEEDIEQRQAGGGGCAQVPGAAVEEPRAEDDTGGTLSEFAERDRDAFKELIESIQEQAPTTDVDESPREKQLPRRIVDHRAARHAKFMGHPVPAEDETREAGGGGCGDLGPAVPMEAPSAAGDPATGRTIIEQKHPTAFQKWWGAAVAVWRNLRSYLTTFDDWGSS